MDSHAEKDKRYHADIAAVYDYITNEPRRYPNELLFRPIDRRIRPARLMLDLGCGTGQMLFRYGHLAERIIAVDHSEAMLSEARRKARERGWSNIEWVEQDLDAFLSGNTELRADLVTCVGVLHHLDQEGLDTFMRSVSALMPGGQIVIAEPIRARHVPAFIQERNARSILVQRLAEAMPPESEDPDEEPLDEAALHAALAKAGIEIRTRSKGFELFHVTDPLSFAEKLFIRYVYWRYGHRGDVVALLGEMPAH